MKLATLRSSSTTRIRTRVGYRRAPRSAVAALRAQRYVGRQIVANRAAHRFEVAVLGQRVEIPQPAGDGPFDGIADPVARGLRVDGGAAIPRSLAARGDDHQIAAGK